MTVGFTNEAGVLLCSTACFQSFIDAQVAQGELSQLDCTGPWSAVSAVDTAEWRNDLRSGLEELNLDTLSLDLMSAIGCDNCGKALT